jgi:hypothetical protein
MDDEWIGVTLLGLGLLAVFLMLHWLDWREGQHDDDKDDE